MTSKSKSKSAKAERESAPREKGPRDIKKREKKGYVVPLLIALSVLGVILSLYLTYLHYTGGKAAFCAEGSDCDYVQQSSFATVLGVPAALLGVIGYALITALTLANISTKRKWLLLYVAALAGVTFSAYLTYVELFLIEAICRYCVVSALFMLAIFLILLFGKDRFYPKFSGLKTSLLGLCVIAIVLITSYSLQYEEIAQAKLPAYEISPADSFTVGLAKYMGSQGAVMYGSYKCPHCNDQKKMFGSAFEYIKYVECHPQGPDANPSLCTAHGVRNFPTWEINGKYYQGALSLERLSALSGFEEVPQ